MIPWNLTMILFFRIILCISSLMLIQMILECDTKPCKPWSKTSRNEPQTFALIASKVPELATKMLWTLPSDSFNIFQEISGQNTTGSYSCEIFIDLYLESGHWLRYFCQCSIYPWCLNFITLFHPGPAFLMHTPRQALRTFRITNVSSESANFFSSNSCPRIWL